MNQLRIRSVSIRLRSWRTMATYQMTVVLSKWVVTTWSRVTMCVTMVTVAANSNDCAVPSQLRSMWAVFQRRIDLPFWTSWIFKRRNRDQRIEDFFWLVFFFWCFVQFLFSELNKRIFWVEKLESTKIEILFVYLCWI